MRRPISTQALLSHLPLFRGLGRAQLDHLAGLTRRHALQRGEVLFREGATPAGLYAVVFGRVALSTVAGARRRKIVELVEPGRSFGDAVLFLGRPSLVTATAAMDSLVVLVPKQAVLDALASDPVFAQRVIGNLARRVETLVRQLQGYKAGSGAKRFAAWLLRRPGVAESAGEATVTLPAAKKTIAAQLNLSAEHFSRILRELSAQGLISVRGRQVGIPDTGRLRDFLSAYQGSPARPERASRAMAPLGTDVIRRHPTGVLT